MNISRRSSSKRFRKASIYISRSSVANASTKNNLENATAPTLQVFVKDDPNEGKTFGRKIVEQYLHKVRSFFLLCFLSNIHEKLTKILYVFLEMCCR